nr:MAG TPA: hypothetical protein [Herelleviridae sp.]
MQIMHLYCNLPVLKNQVPGIFLPFFRRLLL